MRTKILLLLLIAAMMALTALGHAQAADSTVSGFYRPLTLASAANTNTVESSVSLNGEAEKAALVRKTLNPVASLISLPIQNNWDFGVGEANAMRYTANIQPVVPFSISADWNLIVRTILPVVYAESPMHGGTTPKVPKAVPNGGVRFAFTLLFPK